MFENNLFILYAIILVSFGRIMTLESDSEETKIEESREIEDYGASIKPFLKLINSQPNSFERNLNELIIPKWNEIVENSNKPIKRNGKSNKRPFNPQTSKKKKMKFFLNKKLNFLN